MTQLSDTDQRRALDLGLDDWTWLYELAFWLGPDEETADLPDLVPGAQHVLIQLLNDGLAEVATLDRQTGEYAVLDAAPARRVVEDPESWRTAEDLVERGSSVLFAYGITNAGRGALFGAP